MHKAGAHVRREEARLRDTQERIVMEADGLMYQVTKLRKATDGSSSPVAWRETRKGPSCQDFSLRLLDPECERTRYLTLIWLQL